MWTEYNSIFFSHIDMRKYTRIKLNQNDKKLVHNTWIILVDITELHGFPDFTNYL